MKCLAEPRCHTIGRGVGQIKLGANGLQHLRVGFPLGLAGPKHRMRQVTAVQKRQDRGDKSTAKKQQCREYQLSEEPHNRIRAWLRIRLMMDL